MKWESHEINADGAHVSTTLPQTRSNSFLSRSLATIFTYARTWYERNRPCYECDRPCYEHHAPVMSITPLLRVSHPCYERDHSCATWLHKIAHARCLSSSGFQSNKAGTWPNKCNGWRTVVFGKISVVYHFQTVLVCFFVNYQYFFLTSSKLYVAQWSRERILKHFQIL